MRSQQFILLWLEAAVHRLLGTPWRKLAYCHMRRNCWRQKILLRPSVVIPLIVLSVCKFLRKVTLKRIAWNICSEKRPPVLPSDNCWLMTLIWFTFYEVHKKMHVWDKFEYFPQNREVVTEPFGPLVPLPKCSWGHGTMVWTTNFWWFF